MNSSIISRILESPDAYLIVDAAERALEKERELRLKFLDEITDDDRAEFINGEIIKHAPECLKHNRVNGLVLRLLGLCVTKQQNGEFGFGKLMICLTRNAYQPDFCFFNNEKSSQFTADQTLFPAPNFIAEIISISSEQRDRGVKFRDYQAHQIEEYWIIDPDCEKIDQYHLKGDEYELILKSGNGTITSFAIEGLHIPIRSIFDANENLKTLQDLGYTQSSSTLTPPNS